MNPRRDNEGLADK
jgi:farnesyl diphosphate synthase